MIGSKRSSRGVSLIEAVVALAVMGFGMLGIAAMQSSLRQNSDVARQRAEAVRLASEAIEVMRSYSVMATASGKTAYADIFDTAGVPPTQLNLPSTINGVNAVFTRKVKVRDTAAQNRKTVEVLVQWQDRADTGGASVMQEVRLSTEVHGSPPQLAASLIVPGSGTATQRPAGRHASIPPAATLNADGTSTLPVAPSLSWKFNNTTGFIQAICNPTCGPFVNGRLLSGYISFATGSSDPGAAGAELPPDNALAAFTTTPPTAGITLQQIMPGVPPSPPPQCYLEPLPGAPAATRVVAYYCVVFVEFGTSPKYSWSGRSELNLGAGAPLAASIADSSASAYRVCRYTSERSQAAVGNGSPVLRNSDHPYNYVAVSENLVNQNFLVIRAGNGTLAFDCPDDDAATPLVNGRTWHHQPSV